MRRLLFLIAPVAGLLAGMSPLRADPSPSSFADTVKILYRTILPPIKYEFPPPNTGVGMKASVLPLPRPAPGDSAKHFLPWQSIGGFKMFMTWKPGDSKYFTGERLFQDIGQGVYGITGSIEDHTDPNDGNSPTFRQYYAAAFNHSQPNQPAFPDAIDDKLITSDSLANVLVGFPWGHPSDPGHKVTTNADPNNPGEFEKLMKVYYGFIADHMNLTITSLLLPFTAVDVSGGAATPRFLVDPLHLVSGLPNAPKFQFPPKDPVTGSDEPVDFDGNHAFKFSGDPDWYSFNVKYTYYFQQVPSMVDVGIAPAPSSVYSCRNPDGSYENFMACLENPVTAVDYTPGGKPNSNNAIHHQLLDPTFLDGLSTTAITPASRIPKKPGFDPGSTTYFKKVTTNGGGMFFLTKKDIDDLASDDPSQSRLAIKYSPFPTTAFDPRHLAEKTDGELQMQIIGLTDGIRKVRQSAMQIYVQAMGEIRRGTSTTPPADTDPIVAPYSIVDDAYAFTEDYRTNIYETAAELNTFLAATAARGGGMVAGDPFKRDNADKQRQVRLTPAASDGGIAGPAGEDDALIAYYPDARKPEDVAFLGAASSKAGAPNSGDVNSLGNAFFEAHVGRGLAFNYVYDAGGAQIDPSKGSSPSQYWPTPRHVAVVWPYRPYTTDPNPDLKIVGPYVLNLDAVAANDAADYTFAGAEFHSKDPKNPDGTDLCTPIVLSGNLLAAVNDLYEKDSSAAVHMTVEASKRWGENNNGYKRSANLCLSDSNGVGTDSLILRVPLHHEPDGVVITPPYGFIPLSPSWPTYEGPLVSGLTVKAGLNPSPNFVAAYEARVYTGAAAGGGGAGTPALSKLSLDQTCQIGVVNGCGNRSVFKSQTIASAGVGLPTGILTVIPSESPKLAFTVGVPIDRRNFVAGNTPQYAGGANATSLSSRVDDTNRAAVLASLNQPTLDGTKAAGTVENPGDVFFRPAKNPIVKGHSVRLEVLADSVLPPVGFDLYDTDNTPRPAYKNTRYAGFIRSIDVSIFPPNAGGGVAAQPDKKANLYTFSGNDLSANATPRPPMGTMEYVFREATSDMPASGTAVAATDRYYLVQVDVTDVNDAKRSTKVPIFVQPEGVNLDSLSHERERK